MTTIEFLKQQLCEVKLQIRKCSVDSLSSAVHNKRNALLHEKQLLEFKIKNAQ